MPTQPHPNVLTTGQAKRLKELEAEAAIRRETQGRAFRAKCPTCGRNDLVRESSTGRLPGHARQVTFPRHRLEGPWCTGPSDELEAKPWLRLGVA